MLKALIFFALMGFANAQFVGSESCGACHKPQFEAWQKSHHAKSMLKPTRQSVSAPFMDERFENTRFFQLNGQFYIETPSAEGGMKSYKVAYTFGFTPLQQYLIATNNGKLQAYPIAFNATEKRWYRLESSDKHYTSPNNTANFMCMDCHSTNFQKNYTFETDSYDSRFSEVNVGCEACHGAGDKHVKNPLVKFEKPKQEVCAECHSHRTQILPRVEGGGLFKTHIPTPLYNGLYAKNGAMVAEVFTYGSFIQSKMYEKGVTCSDCHLPHSGTLKVEGDGLCHQCHDKTKAHFAEQKDCKACHMPTKTYMGIDNRHDHAFINPSSQDVPYLKKLLTSNSFPELQAALKSNDFNAVYAAIKRLENVEPSQKQRLLAPLLTHDNAYIRALVTKNADFIRTLEFNSDRAESLNDLAMLEADKEKAIRLLESAKKRDKEFIFTYFNLAFLYQNTNETKVLENLNEALQLQPANATAYYLLGLYYTRAKETAKAAEMWKKSEELKR